MQTPTGITAPPPPSDAVLERRLRRWRFAALACFGVTTVAFGLAAAPKGQAPAARPADPSPLVQVTATEVIAVGNLNRVSRSAPGSDPSSVTFYFATDGERSNFALTGDEADAAWAQVTGRAGENWSAAAAADDKK